MNFCLGAIPLTIGVALLCGCSSPAIHDDFQHYPSASREANASSQSNTLYVSLPDQPASESDDAWRPISGLTEQPVGSDANQLFALAQSASTEDVRFAYLEQAALAGSAPAHYELARIFTDGKVRPRDLMLAQEHLQASANLGDPEATRVLGWQFVRGDNGTKNMNAGAALMEAGAQSSVRAQREIGMLYADLYEGFHFGEMAKGEMYLVQAYRSEDIPAATALGRLYIREGRQLEAVAPLQFASERGDKAARKLLSNLGVDTAARVADSPAAGTADNGESFYLQANAIMVGRHEAEDEARAYALFSLAADRGYNLARVEMAALDGIRAQMDSARGAGWLEEERQSAMAHSQ